MLHDSNRPLAPPGRGQPRTRDRMSLYLAALGIGAASVALAFTVPRFCHWFLVPVALCGVAIGTDGIDWLRDRLDVFDPAGLMGILGLHFFFVAPLLHVGLDHWLREVVPPSDWRPWLGGMAALNLCGLIAYHIASRRGGDPRATRGRPSRYWAIRERRFALALCALLLLTASIQAWIYYKYEGILGYITAFETRPDAFRGMGWTFTISESFPILALMGYAVFRRRGRRPPSWVELLLVLVAFFVLKMLFGGLRGSRSNTVWGLFWAVGIVHFSIRRVPRRFLYAGLALLLVFLYGYGFYKSSGLEGLGAFASGESQDLLESHASRSPQAMLLNDLGRSDVQATVLRATTERGGDYHYAFGRTYVGALVLLVPRAVWPNRPPTKVFEGTEALHGAGTFCGEEIGSFRSSRVYGLAGEAMLNFGPLAVPVAFFLLGTWVAAVRRWARTWHPGDLRWLLFPFLVNLSLVILYSDSDNIVVFVVKNGLLPAALVLCGGRSARGEQPTERAIPV